MAGSSSTRAVNAGKIFTWHDSCKHGRELERNFGKGYFEEPRWIIEQCVDQFVEMEPNRANNFCCGAGGGNWPMPYEKESAYHARHKVQTNQEQRGQRGSSWAAPTAGTRS